MKKLFIREVKNTESGMPGTQLEINFTDGTSVVASRSLVRLTRGGFHHAIIAVLEENGKVVSMAKVRSFGKGGRPKQYNDVLYDMPFKLDGTEEVVDYRK